MKMTTHRSSTAHADQSAQSIEERFAPFAKKMKEANLPPLSIRVFRHYYAQLVRGATGLIPNSEALPVESLPAMSSFGERYRNIGEKTMDRVVVLKLNGGLGTSMGMQGPKSLLLAKDDLSFLGIILRQMESTRKTTGARVPLVLMNSFNTHKETVAALQEYGIPPQDLPITFLQNKVPKVAKHDLTPATWMQDEDKEWCPPGHGDLYTALQTSGMLEKMLGAGYEYVFVSNIDNLGAVLDASILGFLVDRQVPFLMEVSARTPADSKGGHLARRPDGELVLRESAQCSPDEIEQFQDVQLYRYFNTNNLWLHLPSLQRMLQANAGVLGLPLIRNEKPVDPTQPDSARVYQLETAMGSAIGVFPGAGAVEVSRQRFFPVKKNNDLIVLWSDVYVLQDDYTLAFAPEREERFGATPPTVDLDERHYLLIDEMKKRFPHGAPSLVHCELLKVRGDVHFGKDVRIVGNVCIVNPGELPVQIVHNAELSGEVDTTISAHAQPLTPDS